MAIKDAKSFVESTEFIEESLEDTLRNEYLEFDAIVNAKGIHNGEKWVAAMLMLDSDYDRLVEIMDDNGNIDTDDLRKSDIPSLIVRNNNDRGYINVTDEDFKRIRPGKRVTFDVKLNSKDGVNYLNGAVIEVSSKKGSTVSRTLEDVGSSKRKPVEAA